MEMKIINLPKTKLSFQQLNMALGSILYGPHILVCNLSRVQVSAHAVSSDPGQMQTSKENGQKKMSVASTG